MRRLAIVAAFVIVATSGIALAASALNMSGSDALQRFTLDLVTTTADPNTPLCGTDLEGINYVGGGSSQGENAMLAGSQAVAPMSRFLGSATCSAAGDAGAPSTAEGLVVGLDGIRIVAAQATTGTACNGAAVDCDPTTDPTAGIAFDTTIPIAGGTYTFNGWRDVLRVLLAGFDHNNTGAGPANVAARDCKSAVRVALATSYGAFFENKCTAQAGDSSGTTGSVCTQIRHIFRPDDFSGTTDTLISLLGLPSIVRPETMVTVFPGGVPTTITQHTGSDPFCNSVRPAFALPQSAAGMCTNGTACTVGGAACSDASTCVPTQPQVTCLQGSDATWDPTQKNHGLFCSVGGAACTTAGAVCNTTGTCTACASENAVFRSTMQDNDPIRRTCFGSGAGAVGTLGEDNCSHSGDLGLVLVMNDVRETNDVGTTSDPLRYNATACVHASFTTVTPPEVWDAVTQGRQVCTRGLLCPNGDICNNAGGCLAPADANANPQCLASKLTAPALTLSSQAVPVANPKGPGIAEGRAYNQHLYKSVGSAGAYQTNGFTTPLPMTGAFYRIQTDHSMNLASTTSAPVTCGSPAGPSQFADMSDQIGCLVQASPCSVGLGGASSSAQPGVVALKVNALDPTISCIQGTSYPLWHKLYLNTLVGFSQLAGLELALAQCEQSGPIMASTLSRLGFAPLPTSGPFPLYGGPYCEDFEEQVLCGAASNNVACFSNSAVGLSTNYTACGDGTVEALEECDNGSANGPPPAVCSTICRANPGVLTPEWSNPSISANPTGPNTLVLSWPLVSDPNVTEYCVFTDPPPSTFCTIGSNVTTADVTFPPGSAPNTPVTFKIQAQDSHGFNSTNGPSIVFCTAVDVCHEPGPWDATARICIPGPPVNIDDGNPATLDTCDPVNGVVHHPVPPVDRTGSTSLANNESFLFTGSNPIQTRVDAGTIAPATMAVVRGTVRDATGTALPGVTVTVAGHPELGSTISQGSGAFDIAVNGGQAVRLHFALRGYLSAERMVQAPWLDYATADDVTMLQPDSRTTAVDLSNTTDIQVARGTAMSDDAGTRQATVLVPPSTQAMMVLPDGGSAPLDTMTVRATEYTVGAGGPSAMPAPLPPTSAYTYALEVSADEALGAGATSVVFSQPLPFYVENFLGFPVGTTVPAGFYDRSRGAWTASPSGVVVQILSESGTPPQAQIAVDSSGAAATSVQLTALGVTTLELQHLASLYPVGQSLWRTQLPHFSSLDFNWGAGPPAGGGPPPTPPPGPPPGPGPDPCRQGGSIIECQRLALGQDIRIAGTPYSLHYSSDHQLGRQSATFDVPLSGSTLAGPVKRIELEVDVAGRVFTKSFFGPNGTPPTPNMATTFSDWDGTDAYGRVLQGLQPATVRVGNTYDTTYQETDAFGNYGNGSSIVASRNEITVWSTTNTNLGVWDNKPIGLGGWTLNIHHAYEPGAQVIHFGDGTDMTPASTTVVIQPVVGHPTSCQNSGDEGPASAANVFVPNAVVVGADGSVYIAIGGGNSSGNGASGGCVRKIGTDSVIRTFAGQCANAGFSGDEGLATSAQLADPADLAVGSDGSVYIADSFNQRIRRVDPSGTIHTVAGGGSTGLSGGFSGDGGPATQATLNSPNGVDVTSDGTIYIADQNNGRIRRVRPDGIITTVGGIGLTGSSTGSGGPATSAAMNSNKVRAASDGSFYVAEFASCVVRRVGTDGIIRDFAGGPGGHSCGFGGDGAQAVGATIGTVADIALGPGGSVFILDGNPTVRRVDPNGIISTIVDASSVVGSAGDNGSAATASIKGIGGIRFAADGSMYIADRNNCEVRQVRSASPGFSFSGNLPRLASRDGRQVYVFDTNGRHLQTLDAFTGTTLYEFAYTAGQLSAVTDVDRNVTTINHDAGGNPVNIVPPFAGATTLTVDVNGYLNSVTDPANQQTTFGYSAQGLMTTMVDARTEESLALRTHNFSYDPAGRLAQDKDPAGGVKTLTPTSVAGGLSVDITTALGRKSTYQTTVSSTGTFSRLNTFPDGTQVSLQFTSSATTTTTVPDGTITTTSQAPDPRFGMLSPMPSTTTTLPSSGLTSTQSTTRSITSANGSLATFTEQTIVNGNMWTRLFNAAAGTWTTTSPVGRQTVTTLDSLGHTMQIAVPGVTPFTFTYDESVPPTSSHGNLMSMSQGSRTWTMAYDSSGYLKSMTDPSPLNHVTSYQNDAVGRATMTTLPDLRAVGTQYDGDSNPTSITLPPPSSNAHGMTYTPVDLLASYIPPSLDSGSWLTQYNYNVDHQRTSETRPDSTVPIMFNYDPTVGRLNSTTYPQGTLTRTYYPTATGPNGLTLGGQLKTLDLPGGANTETITYFYDGFLRSGITWTGPVAGSITFGRDVNFLVTKQTLNGNDLMLGYDFDNLLHTAGPPSAPTTFTVNRDLNNGRLTDTSLGSVTDAYLYDLDGRLSSYTANYNGSLLYKETLAYYADNRIQTKTETILSEMHVWGYTYDPAGRLTDVTKDGSFFSRYHYDPDDNRDTFTSTIGTVNPTYDAQDRLVAYPNTNATLNAAYSYTRNGELLSKTVGSQQPTSYTYDFFGNLLHVGLPATNIDYVVDGENRRVGKKVGGTTTTLTQGFLYQDGLNVVAQLDGSGALVARFVYGTKPNVADYLTNATGTFRIVSDHLGSPRIIVNTAGGGTPSGNIMERIDYDEFGNVTMDTPPAHLTPFGFAGGLYDTDTGLVRFGARDYDPSVGRWTSKDPILFDGGQENLYAYVDNDPVDWIDPRGKDTYSCTRPLKGWSGQLGPFYHEYACVMQGGNVICGGFTPSGSPFGSPGQATSTQDDFYDERRCSKRSSSDTCVDDCVATVAQSPERPWYNVANRNSQCQGWTESLIDYCKAACSQ